jgi:hypothetical protein
MEVLNISAIGGLLGQRFALREGIRRVLYNSGLAIFQGFKADRKIAGDLMEKSALFK